MIKKRMVRTVTIIGVVVAILLATVGLVGCTDRNSINFTVRENAFYFESYLKPSSIEVLIRSVDDLQEIKQKYDMIIESDRYDNAFFAGYAMIVFHTFAHGITIRSVLVIESTLEINLTRHRGFAGCTHVYPGRYHSIIIEFDRGYISEINDVQITVNTRRAR